MSVEAIAWALQQPIQHSTAKFVLVAIANCADENSIAWPSIGYLIDATSQDRKTVQANMTRLRELGYIEDTGGRKGSTKQVIVYRLKEPENGTVKEAQKRNSTENGTVPKFPPKRPVFPTKGAQNSHETGPKTGHGTVKEPSGNRQEPSKKEVLPDWLQEPAWSEWLKFRGKKFTAKARELSLRTLERLHDEGYDPTAVIEQSIERGWTGLFPLKTQITKSRNAAQPENFKGKSYVGTDESAISWL